MLTAHALGCSRQSFAGILLLLSRLEQVGALLQQRLHLMGCRTMRQGNVSVVMATVGEMLGCSGTVASASLVGTSSGRLASASRFALSAAAFCARAKETKAFMVHRLGGATAAEWQLAGLNQRLVHCSTSPCCASVRPFRCSPCLSLSSHTLWRVLSRHPWFQVLPCGIVVKRPNLRCSWRDVEA